MKKVSTLTKLQKLTTQYDASILYQPTKEELDYTRELFPLVIPKNKLCVPKNRNSNPFEWAEMCLKRFEKNKVYILIPGTKFDIYGTRHGRGVGWYDRFLSKLPTNWLRIGIIDKSGFSNTKLIRHSWDQSVQWILVHNDNSWEAYETK